MSIQARRSAGVLADINITPMADIMIVLLVIFMVMTPLIGGGPVRHLPPAAHAREQREAAEALTVSIGPDGATYLGHRRQASRQELSSGLEALLAASAGPRVVRIKADEGLAYDTVRDVLEVCRRAGAEEVALLSRPRIGG